MGGGEEYFLLLGFLVLIWEILGFLVLIWEINVVVVVT